MPTCIGPLEVRVLESDPTIRSKATRNRSYKGDYVGSLTRSIGGLPTLSAIRRSTELGRQTDQLNKKTACSFFGYLIGSVYIELAETRNRNYNGGCR